MFHEWDDTYTNDVFVADRLRRLQTADPKDIPKWDLERLAQDFIDLREAVRAVYYAAHWMPDRPCDAIALWGHLRDAAMLEPGHSPAILAGVDIDLLARAVADATLLYRQHRVGRRAYKALLDAYETAVKEKTKCPSVSTVGRE